LKPEKSCKWSWQTLRKPLKKLLTKLKDVILRTELIEEASRESLYITKAKIVFLGLDSVYSREIRKEANSVQLRNTGSIS